MVTNLFSNEAEIFCNQFVGFTKHWIKRLFHSDFLDVELTQVVSSRVYQSFDGIIGGSCSSNHILPYVDTFRSPLQNREGLRQNNGQGNFGQILSNELS